MDVKLPKEPKIFKLKSAHKEKIRMAATQCQKKYGSIDNPKFRRMIFYEAAFGLPTELYASLVTFGEAFDYSEFGALIIRDFWDVNQEIIEKTPDRWKEAKRIPDIKLMEFAFALIHAAVGGVPIQYKCQRGGGGLCHSVIPDIEKHNSQTGAGFSVDLSVHTEDAGLKTSAEYITLFWIRNNEEVPSYLYSVRTTDWESNEQMEVILRKPIFTFFPDNNYRYTEQAIEMFHQRKMPILYGNKYYPWIRTDNVEMIGKQKSKEAEVALNWLEEEIQENVLYSRIIA